MPSVPFMSLSLCQDSAKADEFFALTAVSTMTAVPRFCCMIPDDPQCRTTSLPEHDSPNWGMLFWDGHQMVSWQRNDGIRSNIVGLLSGGLSGYAFNHSDIGGCYCGVSFLIVKYGRIKELLLHWMEYSKHVKQGNKPFCNRQYYSNDRIYSHFACFAKVYNAWTAEIVFQYR
ncbi:hypothetical protein MLD38_004495 [Melastoma candidum]|uniref:Uncharacterized protein n=1 Tax=Melastoma candidum TaxID=119954 RepID=A0ACB9S7E3_9MYRT|nr:hypothetical protein MLD38_004495 [Melastoma candidum]